MPSIEREFANEGKSFLLPEIARTRARAGLEFALFEKARKNATMPAFEIGLQVPPKRPPSVARTDNVRSL